MIAAMKPHFFFALIFGALFSSGFVSAGEEFAGLEGVPEIVAEVQGKPITRTELIRELVGSSGSKALDRIVNRILIEQAAAEKKVVVTPEDIEQQFKRDTADMAEALIRMPWMTATAKIPVAEIVRAQTGMSLEDYKRVVIRQRLLSRRCMAHEFNPSETELRKFFEKYPDLFQHPVKYHAAHILITPLNPQDLYLGPRLRSDIAWKMDTMQRRLNLARDRNIQLDPDFMASGSQEENSAWAMAYAKADQLSLQLMANPGKWNEFVQKYSQDPLDIPRFKGGKRIPTLREEKYQRMVPGDVDWFQKYGPLVGLFYEGAKNLRIGEISRPVKTSFGYHVIKMLDIYRPPVVTYADARERVRELYLIHEIELHSESWLHQLSKHADLKTEKATIWPPRNMGSVASVGIPEPAAEPENIDPDPIVGRVNGTPIKRSEVWRDLLASEGEEALKRLINREVVMGILKRVGVAHMEWICANPNMRPLQAPPMRAIKIGEEQMQKELNDDRLEYDRIINDKEQRQYAGLSFDEYVYRRYGQSQAEYRRAIEAGLVMLAAIRQKVVPRNSEEFEQKLQLEFALAREQYSENVWYEVSHILIAPAGGMYKAGLPELTAAGMTAENIYKQCLAQPDSFDQLVEKYSDDTAENKSAHGSLGACYEGRTLPDFPESRQFYDVISKQNLEAGQFTPVLRTARGFHIVRVDKKHPATHADFADKRKQVERDYINEQAKYYAEIWMRALNNRAVVKHFYYKPTFAFEQPDSVDQGQLPGDNFKLPK